MSKRNKYRRTMNAGSEHQSDQRTARFVVNQVTDVQDQLCDLVAELRLFEHFSEIEDIGTSLFVLQRLKRKYRKFIERGVWED